MGWIALILVVLLLIAFLYLDHKKKSKTKNELFKFAQTMTSAIFPNGKEDHEEGAKIIYESINGKMNMEECKDLFIKAAIYSNIGDDLDAHLRRSSGNSLTDEDIKAISGFLVLRKLMMLNGKPVRFSRDPKTGAIFCKDRESSSFKKLS